MESRTIFRTAIGALALGAALFIAEGARAEDLGAPRSKAHAPAGDEEWPKLIPVERRPRARRWYGWQILAADAGSATLLGVGVAAHSTAAYAGAVTFVLAPPIIHLVHRHGGKAAASLGMRVVPPIFFAWWYGSCLSKTGESTYAPCNDGLLGLAITSAVIAIGVDAALIASEDVPPPTTKVSIAPSFEPRTHSVSINVAGAF